MHSLAEKLVSLNENERLEYVNSFVCEQGFGEQLEKRLEMDRRRRLQWLRFSRRKMEGREWVIS